MLAQKGLNALIGMSLPWGSTDGPQCFIGLAYFLGLTSGPVSLIFRTLSVAPQPLCTVYLGKGCNVSRFGCNFHVFARGWIS